MFFYPMSEQAFSAGTSRIQCVLELVIGGERHWEIRVPAAKNAAEAAFVKEYCYASFYNLISTFGGKRMRLYVSPMDSFSAELCGTLDDVFQVHRPKRERRGYGKCLNVTDRINAAMGEEPFSFQIVLGPYAGLNQPQPTADALATFRSTVVKARTATLCGIDVGGTDIKVVGIRDGMNRCGQGIRLVSGGNDSSMEQIIEPILLMERVIARTAMSLPDTAEAERTAKSEMLQKRRFIERSDAIAPRMPFAARHIGEPLLIGRHWRLFSGCGDRRPDRRRRDAIKREESARIRRRTTKAEFSKLSGAQTNCCWKQCRPDGKVHLSQRRRARGLYGGGGAGAFGAGKKRAQTACLRIRWGRSSARAGSTKPARFRRFRLRSTTASIDLGNHPGARLSMSMDVRSVNNFNTGLARNAAKVLQSERRLPPRAEACSRNRKRPSATRNSLTTDFSAAG